MDLSMKAINRCEEIIGSETFEYEGVECVVFSDAEECYKQGYKDAVNEACEWLYSRQIEDLEVPNIEKFINDFRQAMEE